MKKVFFILSCYFLASCSSSLKTVPFPSSYSCKERRSISDSLILEQSSYFKIKKEFSGETITLSGKAEYTPSYYKPILPVTDSEDEDLDFKENVEKLPIRHALVIARDSSGEVIQYGYTKGKSDNAGDFSLVIPKESAEKLVTIEVRTQPQQEKGNFVVFNCPEPPSRSPFVITSRDKIPTDKDKNDISLHSDRDQVTGGFYIFSQILEANEAILEANQNCSSLLLTPWCNTETFSPQDGPFLGVYWDYGFSPGSYFGENSEASFTVTLDNADLKHDEKVRVFIGGGLSGDATSTDSDHFDRGIILHEYYHYLSEAYSKSSSPGGSHDLAGVYDPRLVFEEGFANFFPLFVVTREVGKNFPYLVDNVGETVLNTKILQVFNMPFSKIDTYTASRDVPFTRSNKSFITDIPELEGEGNYRELNIAKTFWKMLSSQETNDDVPAPPYLRGFSRIWSALTNKTIGLASKGEAIEFSHFIDSYHDLFSTEISKETLETSFLNPGKHNNQKFFRKLAYDSSDTCSETLRGTNLLSSDIIASDIIDEHINLTPHPYNAHYYAYSTEIVSSLSPKIELEILSQDHTTIELDFVLYKKPTEGGCTEVRFYEIFNNLNRIISDYCVVDTGVISGSGNNTKVTITPSKPLSAQGDYLLVVYKAISGKASDETSCLENKFTYKIKIDGKTFCNNSTVTLGKENSCSK